MGQEALEPKSKFEQCDPIRLSNEQVRLFQNWQCLTQTMLFQEYFLCASTNQMILRRSKSKSSKEPPFGMLWNGNFYRYRILNLVTERPNIECDSKLHKNTWVWKYFVYFEHFNHNETVQVSFWWVGRWVITRTTFYNTSFSLVFFFSSHCYKMHWKFFRFSNEINLHSPLIMIRRFYII